MSTVLISSADHLASLRERVDFAGAHTFSDTEALRALEMITRERPAVVALEQGFASTSRGAALINRIKADPHLSGCEIRIVGLEAAAHAASPAATAVATAAAPAPLDQRGTRRAARTRVTQKVEVLVDGNPVQLIDVSVVGAQVVSPTILRPNQRIRVTLQDPARPIRVSGGVAWASFEMPKEGVRYRAGIEFFDADPAAVGSWVARLPGSQGLNAVESALKPPGDR